MLRGSLSAQAGIISVLYVLLSAIAIVVVDLRLVLIPTACAVLGLVVGGFVVYRPVKAGLVLGWPAQTASEDELGVIVINGEPCPFQGYEQDLLVEIRPRRLSELLACSVLAASTLYFLLSGNGMNTTGFQIGAFEAEIICMTGFVVLLRSLRWFTERRFLRFSRLAFGSILGIDPGFFSRGLTYQFFDQKGERRGGRGPLSSVTDNVVLVLYRPTDPDMNTVQSAFVFHCFRIGLLPGRRKTALGTGAEA